MAIRARIEDVLRKPSKCPVCGEQIVDIIYGSGDFTEIDFLFKYRKNAIMGGDNIPRRPPIWACSCGCKRFRKVNPDGSYAPVKVKLLKNVRPAPASLIIWESAGAEKALQNNEEDQIRTYTVDVITDFDEYETLSIAAVSNNDAMEMAEEIIYRATTGLKGRCCKSIEIVKIVD